MRDPRNAAFDSTFRRHVVAHEREPVPVPFLELGRHADAVVTADDGVARLHVAQLTAHSPSVARHDHRVHPLILYVDPAPAEPHVCAVVGRGVEIVGHTVVLLGRLDRCIALTHGMAAERRELLQQLVQRSGIGRRDPHLHTRGVVIRAADIEEQDFVRKLLCSMILSKIADNRPESMRCPAASTVSLAAMCVIVAVRFVHESRLGHDAATHGGAAWPAGPHRNPLRLTRNSQRSLSQLPTCRAAAPAARSPYGFSPGDRCESASRSARTLAATRAPIAMTGKTRPMSDIAARV